MKKPAQRFLVFVLAVAIASPALARKPGEPIKPGYNPFSKQQDMQLGAQAAAEIRKKYAAVPNQELQDYIRRVGERLASQKVAKESGFPFTFTLVSEKSVNAFALPGGPAFVHTGLIAACDNEAQLAGVLAHEISHVILRHGTNQVFKANLLKIPAIVAGAVTGSNLLAQVTNLGATTFLLTFSRGAESEADAMGARIMNDAGYNPLEMARFFAKLEGEGNRAPQFLSDHPNPGNRVSAVEEEIRALPQRQYGGSVGDFSRMKALVARLFQTPVGRNGASGNAVSLLGAVLPSGGFKQLKGRGFALAYPGNWEVLASPDSPATTIAPPVGVIAQPNGTAAIGYGVKLGYYVRKWENPNLKAATDELIARLRETNPQMQIFSAPRGKVKIEEEFGMLTAVSNRSPLPGQTERDILLTIFRPMGLFYMIFIAPTPEMVRLQPTFDEMIRSIRFSN